MPLSERTLWAARAEALAEGDQATVAWIDERLSKSTLAAFAAKAQRIAAEGHFTHMLPGEAGEEDFIEAAQQVDARLRERYPTMDEGQRLRTAFEMVQKSKGTLDQADNRAYFQMRRAAADPFASRESLPSDEGIEGYHFHPHPAPETLDMAPDHVAERERLGEGVRQIAEGRAQQRRETAEGWQRQREQMRQPKKIRRYSDVR